MIKDTGYSISNSLINQALQDFDENGKYDISMPTGDFFYDPWVLKDEYQNTPWEEIWNSLPLDKGQTRVISLESGTCYFQHSDIDDRYHLNLSGEEAFLIDLKTQEMHECKNNGKWYEMDAGKIHSAVNFGYKSRYQLVSRKLLSHHQLTEATSVLMTIKKPIPYNARYLFDNFWSPLLNLWAKNGLLDYFKRIDETSISFYTTKDHKRKIEELAKKSPLEVIVT